MNGLAWVGKDLCVVCNTVLFTRANWGSAEVFIVLDYCALNE